MMNMGMEKPLVTEVSKKTQGPTRGPICHLRFSLA